MNKEIVKTVKWSDAKELLVALAGKSLGRTVNSRPADFSEFIASYPIVLQKRMFDFLEGVVLRNSLDDVTSQVVVAEDKCLFSAQADTAIDIVLRHLDTLNDCGKPKALWAYLDTDKKAVIHFVKKGAWYAEAYFSSPENFSVLHLLVTAEGRKHFIPVTFSRDLSKVISSVGVAGGLCLHDYLPRVKYDFLSKGKGRSRNRDKSCYENDKSSKCGGRRNKGSQRYHDEWDEL